MEFQNEFDVKAPLDQVWDAVLDLERVAPCVPGAEVLERTSDDGYKVGIKVKVGPVSLQYRGDVEIGDKDPSMHHAQVTAKARVARGQGPAHGIVGLTMCGNVTTHRHTIHTQAHLINMSDA